MATSVHVSHLKYRHKVNILDVNHQCCLLGDVANYHLEYKKLRYVESLRLFCMVPEMLAFTFLCFSAVCDNSVMTILTVSGYHT